MTRRAGRGACLLAALAGASAWLSFATLTVTSPHGARVGMLPALWLLPVSAAAAGGLAWGLRLATADAWPLLLTLALWLPWLPVRVSPAMLLWDGPLETVIWMAALGGVAIASFRSRAAPIPRWSRNARGGVVLAAAFFGCAIAAGYALRDALPSGDEPHYLVITQSLLRDGDLRIENNHTRGDVLEYYPDPVPPDYLARGADGEIYSVHAPGVSLLVLPAFALAGYPGALATMAVLTALALALMWRTAAIVTSDPSAAWAATLAGGFSAIYLLHAFTIFPDPAGAVVLAIALCGHVALDRSDVSLSPGRLAAIGACLAALPWLHTRFAILAGALGVAIALRLLGRPDRWRTLAAFAAGPVVAAVAWFAMFYAIYGTPNPAAPYGGSRQNAWEWMPAGLIGLAFDQQFGLLANVPIMAMLPYGWVRLWRLRPRLAVEMALVAVPYALIVASFGMWWGGWSAPARFLVPLVPFMVLLLAVAWAGGRLPVRTLFVALAGVGVANAALRLMLDRGALLYNLRDGYDRLLDVLSRSVNLPLAFPSVHRLGVETSAILGAVWLVAAAACVVTLALLPRRLRSHPGAWWAVASVVMLAGGSLALDASWRIARTIALTPESSEVWLLRRSPPSGWAASVALPRVEILSPDAALRRIELSSSVRARGPHQDGALLALPQVPAGEYRVAIEGARTLAGTLSVTVGATSQVIEAWPLEERTAGLTDMIVRLPVDVRALAIRGDAAARQRIQRVTLRPERLTPVAARPASRAARYDRVTAFFLDDGMYMEPGGVWTRGDSSGDLVLAADDGGDVNLDIAAGPVPVTLVLRSEAGVARLTLGAGERQRHVLAPGRWNIATAGSFRPRDFDPSSQDGRALGVRLEFSADAPAPQ